MTKAITIDGPAGAGKSTVARIFAKKIGYEYIESGLIYRAITYFLLEKQIDCKDDKGIRIALQELKIDLIDGSIIINDKKVDDCLREEKIDKSVAQFSCIKSIRDYSRILQHSLAQKQNSVIEGRDIGSVVFPIAYCKFYLDANINVRAKRRCEELQQKQLEVSIEEIRKSIAERDKTDKKRKNSPLSIPNDAFFIDTSNMSKEQVLEKMLELFKKKESLSQDRDEKSKEIFEKAMDLYQKKEHTSGEVLKVNIISINKRILVNLGEKVEAYINEIETEKLKRQNLKEGDEISVAIVSKEGQGIIVSKIAVDIEQKQKQLKENFEKKEPVQGVIKSYVEDKGFNVSLHGTRAFCPIEEYSTYKLNPRNQVGKYFLFEILSWEPKPLIVSRKRVWEKMQKENRDSFFQTVQVGDIIDVKVVDIRIYGVIVKIKDGMNSLLRNEEISWQKVGKKNLPFVVGDTVSVKVTKINYDDQRIEISKKELEEDPFLIFIEKYRKNDILNVKVINVESFGAFVEVSPGVSGLIHISDLSWRRDIKHAKDIIKKNEELEAVVLNIDEEKRQIRLGVKQLVESPWAKVDEICTPNSFVTAKVYKVTPQSIYCTIDGIINSEVYFRNCYLYEKEKQFDFNEIVKVGDDIKARIIKINHNFHKVDLEMLEEIEDDWKNLKINFSDGSKPLKGTVTEIVEKGVNVKINEEITGFCHISQFEIEQPESIETVAEIGKEYFFIVQSINEEKKKLNLSRKDYLLKYEKKSNKDGLNNPPESTITLSQIIKK